MEALKIKSSAFAGGARTPERYIAREDDLSPGFEIKGIDPNTKSIAITLDSASHPIFPNYNHWVTQNLPVQIVIPEEIPHGGIVASFGGAIQGIACGRDQYKGPKLPLRSIHTYVFTVFVLNYRIDLVSDSRKQDLLRKVKGHISQQARLSGKFQNHRE